MGHYGPTTGRTHLEHSATGGDVNLLHFILYQLLNISPKTLVFAET